LNDSLRNKNEAECRNIFDNLIIETLQNEERLEETFTGGVADIFTYERFKNARNSTTNFSKYLLMRIDRWLSDMLDKPSYCSESAIELEDRFNRSNRKRYGMHLEHIYAHNEANRNLFLDPITKVVDAALFDQTRNYLGMVLLLKDSQNISSSNDLYKDKLDDYATSNIIWNELLAGRLPDVDERKLPPLFQNAAIAADSNGAFPRDQVEQRQKVFFEAVKAIWSQV